MILLLGGINQGQNEYAIKHYSEKKLLLDMHELVYNTMKENKYNQDEFLKKMEEHDCITFNEVGCGIVPIDKFERAYRDNMGFLTQKLAEKSDTVIRFVCGIPQVLKRPNL